MEAREQRSVGMEAPGRVDEHRTLGLAVGLAGGCQEGPARGVRGDEGRSGQDSLGGIGMG